MDGRRDKWKDGWKDGWMGDEWMQGFMSGYMIGRWRWKDEWVDGLVVGQSFRTKRDWSAQYTTSSPCEQRPEVGGDLLKTTQLMSLRAEDPQTF